MSNLPKELILELVPGEAPAARLMLICSDCGAHKIFKTTQWTPVTFNTDCPTCEILRDTAAEQAGVQDG